MYAVHMNVVVYVEANSESDAYERASMSITSVDDNSQIIDIDFHGAQLLED